MKVSQCFPEHVKQAEEMNANQMDWYPEAKFPFANPGDDLALVAYSDGIWIVETHGRCVEDHEFKYTKIELVTKDSWMRK